MKKIFLILLFSLITNWTKAATINGSIADLNNKILKHAEISVAMNIDGKVNVNKVDINPRGEYSIYINYDGFINILVSLDSTNNLTIPFFVQNAGNYNLNIYLPKEQKINFRNIKLESKNKGLVSGIYDMYNAIYHAGMVEQANRDFKEDTDINRLISATYTQLTSIEKLIKQSKQNNENKFILYVCYINAAYILNLTHKLDSVNKPIVKDFIKKYPPETSYLYTFAINWEIVAAILDSGFKNKYFAEILEKNTSDFLKCNLLYQATLYNIYRVNNTKDAYYFYEKLLIQYPDSPQTEFAKNIFVTSNQLQTGKQAPMFSLNSIDNHKDIFDNNYFLGKYLLMNFLLMDSSSINEINNIDEAYNAFYDAPFEILTIALAKSINNISQMRKNTSQMNWHVAYEPAMLNGQIANTFAVKQAPMSILIAPDGTIVEVGNNVLGDNLIPTLKKYLNQ